MSSSWESQLTPQESKLFFKLFQTVGKSQPGIVTGQEAVMFFATSGVPNPILSEIWEEADRDQLGYLTPETFSIALKLIACAQHGKEATDPVLATPVPLPQFDGVAASPAIVHAPSPASQPITPAEREKYASIFKVHQKNGTIDADSAKSVFLLSKLPVETLSQIWFLADVRQSGSLNQAEFTIAMHYIAKLMDGSLSSLPDKLPSVVYQSASSLPMSSPAIQNTQLSVAASSPALQNRVMTPPQRARTIDSLGNLAFGSSVPESHWDVTTQEKAQFDAYFDKIDSARTGIIQGKEAVEFFKNSRLPENDLAQIWDLSDIQHRGCLSRNEFAVAMHLIHKKLRGEAIPTTLPASLHPPQTSFSPQIPMQASPVVQSQARSPQPPQSHSLLDDNHDLLGDFGNDQVSSETNQVNLLQNQIQSMSMSTTNIKSQKVTSEQALEQLLKQKKELEAQFTQVKMAHEQEVKDLNEIQEQVRREESEWNAVRTEYEAAQQQLSDLQNEVAQMNQTLANGRAETESLTRRINEIQEETKQANIELENLRNKTKQQNMMLDINRRQVTAAEQDRALAKRNLEDYKATAAMNQDSDDDEEEIEEKEKDKSDSDEFTDAVGATPVEDNKTNTAVSTPALGNMFPSPSAFNNPVTSPFAESPAQANNSVFDDVFATGLSTAGSNTAENVPASTTSDFDAIFGSMASPTVTNTTSPSAAFDPVQWSSPTNSTNSAAKTFRSPPPPPPQSRHHRQPSESVSSVSSSVIGKKQRAPPPPPSAHIKTNDDDFASAFSGQLSEAKIVETPTKKEDSAKDSIKDDDFEAAFSGKLSEAKIVQNTTKDDDFDEFDDAFSNFDGKPAETKKDDKKTDEKKKDWSGFDSFNFGETSSENKPSNDDWDSIFGTTSTATTAAKPTTSGFDDAFSSFDDNFASKQPSSIGLVGDKIEDLVKMGFSEKEAKDALNRYDQDLAKATNYLLDQASKN